MINIFHSRARNAAASLAAALGLIVIPAGCTEDTGQEGADAAEPSVSAAQARDLPDYDPEATNDGRTAEEIAQDLRETNAYRQNKALEELIGMGVDALPAREGVRYVAEHAGGPAMSDTLTDKHRLQALSTLYAMQAPEAVDLLREKILDPEYLTRDASYVKLIEAMNQVGVDHETQISDLSSIIDTHPDHVRRLVSLDALDAPVQAKIQSALNDAGDDPQSGMQDDASQDAPASDTGEAGTLPENEAQDLLDEALATENEQDIRLAISRLETMVRDVSENAASDADKVAAHRLFTDSMTILIEGSSVTHAVVGIERQVLFLQRNEPVALAPALDPIFELLEEGGTGPAVHNAAVGALQQTPGRLAAHAPDYFVERTVGFLWSSDTPEQADLPVRTLISLIQSPDYVDLTVDTIAAQIEPHLNEWAVNPATAVVMYTGRLPRLDHGPVRETAAIVMGEALASPALDMDYLGDHFARGGAAIATLESNTVEGVIAVFSPTIFAPEKPARYPFPMESFMQPMLGLPAWLQRDPEALEIWSAFLERVAALDDPDFSPVAREALEAL